ncbi:MAG TPA: ferredoxin--NADP reductase [Caulobacteraceae bacterium]|nr:ferredoxin--NADP reductase [Caulobacteraceae bacterium]
MTDAAAAVAPLSAKARAAFYVETVTYVHHWTDELFTLKTTRDPGLRFDSGQFVMLGLEIDGKPLLRAYSIASPYYADELEFFSIKVQDGPLTKHLQHLKVGDEVLVGKKPTGTLVLDGLRPGKNLYLLGTGTGLAPFLSLVRDPETYERYEKVIVTHTVRHTADLAYRQFFEHDLPNDPDLGEIVKPKLIYYPTVTRDPFKTQGRITDLIESGQVFEDIGLPPLDVARDRLMLCGGPSVLADLKALLLRRGYEEGSVSKPGDFVLERAFVET